MEEIKFFIVSEKKCLNCHIQAVKQILSTSSLKKCMKFFMETLHMYVDIGDYRRVKRLIV